MRVYRRLKPELVHDTTWMTYLAGTALLKSKPVAVIVQAQVPGVAEYIILRHSTFIRHANQ